MPTLPHAADPSTTDEVRHTARYLAHAVCDGRNDLDQVIGALRAWEEDLPGVLRASAVAQASGTEDDLAMALLFEAATGA